jgi:hypothetical protein
MVQGVVWVSGPFWRSTENLCQPGIRILNIDEAQIPDSWPMHPDFHTWPPKRCRAVVWILAQLVLFRTTYEATGSLLEYFDFLQRTRWKAYQQANRPEKVGNYLSILEVDHDINT